AAGDLELNTIINPLRKLLKRVKTFVGAIEAINVDDRLVAVSHGADEHLHQLPFDYLILALGSETNFFGLPGVDTSALTVKTIGDGVAIRNQVITQLEEANSECAVGERQPMLTFVVAGGGFAGVETLGGLNDFVRESLRFYPNLRAEYLRFVLITSEEAILPELDRELGLYAQRKLAGRGIEIITHARVTAVSEGIVTLSNGQKVPSNMLIWAAGTAPNPLLSALPLPKHKGRIAVNENLEVEGFHGVWALGDCAMVPNSRTGGFHPPTAQHAIREARVVAHNVAAELWGGKKKRFHYSSVGQLAAIGRRTGVGNIFGLNFSGFIAWWLWRTVYLSKLPRVEKKIRVALDWTLDLCFAKDFACVNPPPMRSLRVNSPLAPYGRAISSRAWIRNCATAR
ncbi:MAG: NAD(P)/FAD-dependent oxidoreductase, partial [Deltaproteobacteria bacterium]|nr:NAD(P)/FAD-dependent oxidoreductase [Deltaproteobacteria bacterium]